MGMMNPEEILEVRKDLAAAFRWAARLDMHEGVANHFSYGLNDEGTRILINPAGVHFSRITASSLVEYDLETEMPGDDDGGPDPTAAAIHGAMHRNNPHAKCVVHLHPKYITILSTLADPVIKPIDQNTARFHNRVAYDLGFDGMGLGDEATRLSNQLGNHAILLMGAHGAMTAGPRVADAFDDMYYLEKACETLIGAYQTGMKLAVLDEDTAEKTAQQWADYSFDLKGAHLSEIRKILDKEEPDYAS